eukprot:5590911-Amphidinium_carterae.4
MAADGQHPAWTQHWVSHEAQSGEVPSHEPAPMDDAAQPSHYQGQYYMQQPGQWADCWGEFDQYGSRVTYLAWAEIEG